MIEEQFADTRLIKYPQEYNCVDDKEENLRKGLFLKIKDITKKSKDEGDLLKILFEEHTTKFAKDKHQKMQQQREDKLKTSK